MNKHSSVRLSIAKDILSEDVLDERKRQLEKWGVQKLPDGTGSVRFKYAEQMARARTDHANKMGTVTWQQVLEEETAEAFASSDYETLRAELIQVAAVAVAWIEDLDTRLVPLDLSMLGPDD